MIQIANIDVETHTYLQPFYNVETSEEIDWYSLATDVYTVVSGFVPDKTSDFPVVPTTFGLHPDTPVLLESGDKYPIGRWYDERQNTTLGILLFNPISKNFEKGNCFKISVAYYTTTYTITLTSGASFKCSADLPILLNNCTWKGAQDLIVDDELKSYFNFDVSTKKYSIAPNNCL